jgi:glycosyltransferase involved in cell wall biosynthesis
VTATVRIGFISAAAPDDVHAQSGIPWFMRKALERYCGDVDHLGPLRPWIARPLRLASRASRRLSRHHRFIDTNSEQLSRAYGRLLSAKIASTNGDWLFAPYASAEIAHLETMRPIVYYSDATFRIMCDYYPGFTGLSPRSKRAGDALEARAIERAAVACFASDWAAASAVRDYGAAPEKVFVVPMSANMLDSPPRESLRFQCGRGPIRLLFVGVDWERKGGSIAHDALRALHRLGVDATLTIVGCVPPARYRAPAVSIVGFLSKDDPRQRATLDALFRDSDFLIAPTQAECYGCVFVEAAAFALPSIAPSTGGVSSALANGASGLLLRPGATGEEYAAAIIDALTDADRYRALRVSARRAFDAQLSWEAWSRRVNQLTAGLRAAPTPAAADPVRESEMT